MNHDWQETQRTLAERMMSPSLSAHYDYSGKYEKASIRSWTCSKCGYDVETNIPIEEYKKAPDCYDEIVRRVLLD